MSRSQLPPFERRVLALAWLSLGDERTTTVRIKRVFPFRSSRGPPTAGRAPGGVPRGVGRALSRPRGGGSPPRAPREADARSAGRPLTRGRRLFVRRTPLDAGNGRAGAARMSAEARRTPGPHRLFQAGRPGYLPPREGGEERSGGASPHPVQADLDTRRGFSVRWTPPGTRGPAGLLAAQLAVR